MAKKKVTSYTKSYTTSNSSNSSTSQKKVEVVWNPEVHAEIMYYVNRSNFEVSGLGEIEVIKEKGTTILYVPSIKLLTQTNTSAHTEIDAEDLALYEYECYQRGNELGPRMWWHSHVKMGVFWSQTDIDTINKLSKSGWFAATVFNQYGKHRSAYAQGGDVPLFIDEISTSFRYINETFPEEEAWKENYDQKVTNTTYVTTTYKTPYKWSWGGIYQGYQDNAPPAETDVDVVNDNNIVKMKSLLGDNIDDFDDYSDEYSVKIVETEEEKKIRYARNWYDYFGFSQKEAKDLARWLGDTTEENMQYVLEKMCDFQLIKKELAQ